MISSGKTVIARIIAMISDIERSVVAAYQLKIEDPQIS